MSPYNGFQRWAHQLWLDVSSARFWKSTAHHYLRLTYDMLATGVALALLVFAFAGPAVATAIDRSDADVGFWFISPSLAWLLAVVALAAAATIVVFAPVLDAAIDRWLLPPSATAALQHQVSALTDARQGAVSSAQTERHRIERDLHDSVQPRLVSLAMTIGLAQTKLDTDLPQAKKLIGEAHDDAKSALVELRNVVRGIAPTILADRGLDAALSSVVQRIETSGVPTSLNVYLPRRLPDEVESVAYFVVAEALTNVAKHARASQAVVTVRFDEASDALHVSVFDDGVGGAAVTVDDDATGLRGLAERVRAARGTFEVSSPATGSTIVTAVLPCES
jgi:signal transduction histidine kinase